MPELPEVEIAARFVRHLWQGQKAISVWAEEPTPAAIEAGVPSEGQLAEALVGRRLIGVRRLGKRLCLDFDGGQGLSFHLGMTGKFVQRPAGREARFTRVAFGLESGWRLLFCDARRFGKWALLSSDAFQKLPEIRALGPDALLEPPSAGSLRARLAGCRRPIKVALMDQALLAGLGNILASEALFRARISPERCARELSDPELARLAQGISDAIAFSLEETFEPAALHAPIEAPAGEPPPDVAYLEEGGANLFSVYGKAGQPCPRCQRPIEAFRQAGRTTYWCPACQKGP